MMRATILTLGCVALACALALPARAAKVDPDVVQLTGQLQQISDNPVLAPYAQAQRTLARDAIAALANSGRSARPHALFMAEQRVALAQAAAEAGADRAHLDRLQREHDQLMLQASQADAALVRAQLARQRLQYQAAVEQAQTLQAQGAAAAQQAQQAQAEATQAKRLAAAQARAAALARKEAHLAEAAQALQSGGTVPAASGAASLRLGDASFAAGADNLDATARRRVADFARAHASQRIVVEPRAASGQRVLAGRRAVAVEAALSAAGARQVSISHVAHAARGAEVEVRARP